MNLLDDLIGSIEQDAPVRSILVGAHWTAVCSRSCGLASTLFGDKPHGHQKVREVGRLERKSAFELAELARSDNPLEASIGVAAINSLLEVDEERSVEINAGDFLIERGAGMDIALVGHFPFIPDLRRVAAHLWVIEQRPLGNEYPAEAGADLIPQAGIVALTGSALINHTLDGLLDLCRSDALVMVLGPSTPLSPVLFQHGATYLSGALVLDEAALLHKIAQGATFQQLKKEVRLLTLPKSVDSEK